MLPTVQLKGNGQTIRGGTLSNTHTYSQKQNLNVGGSKLEMVESASGLFREVMPAVEVHALQSIDVANRLFPFSIPIVCVSITSTGDVGVSPTVF